jgi:DNA-binding CsgD family transcriptional regulator
MGVIVITQKEWDIPQRQLDFLNQQEIESILNAFNQSCGGCYYMLDYYNKKVIVDSLSSLVLCGYPKKALEKYGFKFFRQILDADEQRWLNTVNAAGWEVLFSLPEQKRMNLKLSYDLTVKTVNGIKYVLHHTITPFKLCENGNMWLGLCHVVISSSKEMDSKADIVNTETGQTYKFSNGKFVMSKTKILTYKERQILSLLATDMTGEQISKTLGVALTVYNRHKRSLFDKLGVDKVASAIHKAHIDGLI